MHTHAHTHACTYSRTRGWRSDCCLRPCPLGQHCGPAAQDSSRPLPDRPRESPEPWAPIRMTKSSSRRVSPGAARFSAVPKPPAPFLRLRGCSSSAGESSATCRLGGDGARGARPRPRGEPRCGGPSGVVSTPKSSPVSICFSSRTVSPGAARCSAEEAAGRERRSPCSSSFNSSSSDSSFGTPSASGAGSIPRPACLPSRRPSPRPKMA
mmetsp:Transcript_5388/g.16703  ORF Transcript_5388/g.16703 Transcript_5388/m.16703 type:complete len:210 (+) Transcript_5388:2-631(+)